MQPVFGPAWSVRLDACLCERSLVGDPQTDTMRLEKLMRALPGSAIRNALGEMRDTGDLEEFRKLIDMRL